MTGVVVGIEDAREALQALDWAMSEAARRHEPLTVVAVVPEQPLATPAAYTMDAAGQGEETTSSTGRWARRAANASALRTLEGESVPVDIEVATGSPAAVLVERSRDASMLVVGRSVSSWLARLLRGSVSNAVVHYAGCPVVVVPDDRNPGRR